MIDELNYTIGGERWRMDGCIVNSMLKEGNHANAIIELGKKMD
jgi:hypothetical protein